MIRFDLADRLAELPDRFRAHRPVTSPTWPLTKAERAQVRILWPRVYQWRGAEPVVSALKFGLMNLGVLQVHTAPQVYPGVVMLRCEIDGQPRAVALDYSDYPGFINEEALEASSLYFKCQYQEMGYGDQRIIRGGYPVTVPAYYKYFDACRAAGRAGRRCDVAGRFGYRFEGDLRRTAVRMLSEAQDIGFVGTSGKVRYRRFLREVATARLCLHLPGNGPFTHRVVEFLGLGTCMISPRFTTQLHVSVEPGIHYVVVSDDLRDLVDTCRYYLTNDEERERIARAGQQLFDRYLHCDQLAGYHVRCILDRLSPPNTAS